MQYVLDMKKKWLEHVIHGNLVSKSMFVYFTAKSVQLANFGTFFVDKSN